MKRLAIAALAVLSLAGGALAVPIVDYFGYGATTKSLGSCGAAGGGWAGAWSGGAAYYQPAPNVTYTATGYSSADNLASTGSVNGGGSANVTQRSLSTPLTGTFWVSAIVSYGDGVGVDALLWLDRPDTTTNYVALRSGKQSLRFNGTTTTGKTIAVGTHLLLAKLTVNAGNDTVDFWVDPNLAGGEAGLPAADMSAANADAYGASFSGVGVSGTQNHYLDCLRIGTFNEVVGVPEPATLSLVALGGLTMVLRRRHA